MGSVILNDVSRVKTLSTGELTMYDQGGEYVASYREIRDGHFVQLDEMGNLHGMGISFPIIPTPEPQPLVMSGIVVGYVRDMEEKGVFMSYATLANGHTLVIQNNDLYVVVLELHWHMCQMADAALTGEEDVYVPAS